CYLLYRDDAQLIGVGDVNRRGERAGVLRRWAGIGHRAGVPVAAIEELNLDIGRHLSAGGRCQIEADRFDRRWVRSTKLVAHVGDVVTADRLLAVASAGLGDDIRRGEAVGRGRDDERADHEGDATDRE